MAFVLNLNIFSYLKHEEKTTVFTIKTIYYRKINCDDTKQHPHAKNWTFCFTRPNSDIFIFLIVSERWKTPKMTSKFCCHLDSCDFGVCMLDLEKKFTLFLQLSLRISFMFESTFFKIFLVFAIYFWCLLPLEIITLFAFGDVFCVLV